MADMNVWKEHYLQQLAHNQQLEAQLKQLDRKVTELRNQLKEGTRHRDNAEQGYEGMSDVTMRQLLRKLEKEKVEIEWQLKECEWRLDQEAAVSARVLIITLIALLCSSGPSLPHHTMSQESLGIA